MRMCIVQEGKLMLALFIVYTTLITINNANKGGNTMYEVKTTSIIRFTSKVDADNYKDFLSNGLRVIRVSSRTTYFNNGDRLIDTSMKSDAHKKYTLITLHGRTITCEKLQKKHIALL